MNTVPVSFGWKSQWNGYDPVLGKDSATELAPGWIAPVVGGPLDPVALCTTLVSVFRHTTDCARQVVTLTGVTAAAELQLTTMGEELTMSCADPALLAMVAWMATGLPPASNAVATSRTVSPRLASEAEAPPADVLTATLVTTCATEMETDPLTPFEEALTAEFPFPSVVTSPAVETPATPGALLDQAKVTWLVTSPRGFEAVAASWTVWPTLAKV